MTVDQLKMYHLQHHPNSHYFDYDTLKFFGERMSEMWVLKDIFTVKDASGNMHDAYCLSSLQHKAPGGPERKYSYFDAKNFEHIMM